MTKELKFSKYDWKRITKIASPVKWTYDTVPAFLVALEDDGPLYPIPGDILEQFEGNEVTGFSHSFFKNGRRMSSY